MVNLPNVLTFFRILLVPLLVVVLLTKPRFEYQEFVGLGIFLLASLTDFLDGFLARRRRQETRLGTLLDPADRKSTRLNSSHSQISYAVFCLKKKIKPNDTR